MEVVQGLENLSEKWRHCLVVLGFFDGFHKGHQALIRQAAAIVSAMNPEPPVLVYTFNCHPLEVVDPSKAPYLLTTLEEKIKLAGQFPIDCFLIGEFSKSLSKLSPEMFLKTIVSEKLKARHVIAGFNYRYGKKHEGNAKTLLHDAKKLGFSVTIVSAVVVNGEAVSSTRIRRLLMEGKVKEAGALLGRPYVVSGKVVKGDGRGKDLGVPTANLEIPERKLVPKMGIYAAIARNGDQEYGSVISIGKRPTFGGTDVVVEAHLLDFEGNLYGKALSLELVSRIRDEEKFSSVDALIWKMKEDIEKGRGILAKRFPLKERRN